MIRCLSNNTMRRCPSLAQRSKVNVTNLDLHKNMAKKRRILIEFRGYASKNQKGRREYTSKLHRYIKAQSALVL